MGDYIELGKLARVVVVGVLLGAGLPAMYALGVQALAGPLANKDGKKGKTRPVRLIVAWLCFAVVIAAVVVAVVAMAASGH